MELIGAVRAECIGRRIVDVSHDKSRCVAINTAGMACVCVKVLPKKIWLGGGDDRWADVQMTTEMVSKWCSNLMDGVSREPSALEHVGGTARREMRTKM